MVTLMAHERIVPLQNICAFAGVTKTKTYENEDLRPKT